MSDRACRPCGAEEIVSGVRVSTRQSARETRPFGEVCLAIFRKPSAWFFKGTSRHSLRARVCGRCAFTELYADDPEELYRIARELADD